MTNRPSGVRRSSKQTFRRRLVIFRSLFREPCTSDDLIAIVNAEFGQDGYPSAAAMALKHDLDALKREYGCEIRFDRTQRTYSLHHVGDFAILDLPRESLEALNFLDTNFPEDHMLSAFVSVQKLLRQMRMLLPDTERTITPSSLTIRSYGRQHRVFDATTMRTIRRAVENRQMLSFSYTSNFELNGSRKHTVAPYGLFMRDGHMYLDAVLIHVEPAGNAVPHTTVEYRLERIVKKSALLLPNVIPAERPPQPRYQLVYRLDAVVARRRDLATFFPDSTITYHDDDTATVRAVVTNLWTTRQVLLRYGGACQVQEPAELVAMFRQTAQELAARYPEPGT